MAEQLNKIQIKAELLMAIAKLQTISETSEADEMLAVLDAQEDKKTILDLLIREIIKTTEQKSYIICYLLLRFCEKEPLENALWNVLKSPMVSDYAKSVVLNLLKDMGNRVNYDEVDEYFESPEDIIDADTKQLLHTAIMNPEAQIDFMDFLMSLPEHDKIVLIESLADDYSEDALANILIPVFLNDPTSKIALQALNILGTTKSQLALHVLLEAKEYVEEDILPAVKRNISALKLSGVREDNALEFYKTILAETKPYESYASYPDGHGNQALIFSREREDETVQIIATVINDRLGIVDCFGFNEVSKPDFKRIVERFYGVNEPVYINHTVLKTLLKKAEDLLHKNGEIVPYEFICWRTLFADIPIEPVPVALILEDKFKKEKISKVDFDKICLAEIVQKWFLDTEFSDEFSDFIEGVNGIFAQGKYDENLDKLIDKNLDKLFTERDKTLWSERIINSAYLKYLANEKNEAQLFYSLYFDEHNKKELLKNIVRKSIYEYYVSMKFKITEGSQTSNLFSRRAERVENIFELDEIECIINAIEARWVQDA